MIEKTYSPVFNARPGHFSTFSENFRTFIREIFKLMDGVGRSATGSPGGGANTLAARHCEDVPSPIFRLQSLFKHPG